MKYSFALFVAATGLFFIASPASADQEDFVARLKTCKEVSSIVQRAQCFDTALDEYDLNTLKRNESGNQENGWKLISSKSTLTDNNNVTITLGANDRFNTKDGMQVRPALVLGCNEGHPVSYVSWNSQISRLDLKNDNEDTVANTRFGADPVVAERWALSTDKTASFIPTQPSFTKRF